MLVSFRRGIGQILEGYREASLSETQIRKVASNQCLEFRCRFATGLREFFSSCLEGRFRSFNLAIKHGSAFFAIFEGGEFLGGFEAKC